MLVYHYTTLEAAISIIQQKLCFRGTRYDSMNDPNEFMFACKHFIPELFKNDSNSKENYSKIYPYIVSFSKKKDDELMWRLYHSEVMLVFDTDEFTKADWHSEGELSSIILCGDVEYATKDTIRNVADKLYEGKNCKIINDNKLGYQLWVLPFIKHLAFEIESEYRLVKIGYEALHADYNSNKESKCDIFEFERPNDVYIKGVKDGNIVLYKNFQLPADSLKGIILYTFDSELFKKQKHNLELLLRQMNFSINDDFIRCTNSYPIR